MVSGGCCQWAAYTILVVSKLVPLVDAAIGPSIVRMLHFVNVAVPKLFDSER